MDVNLSLGQKEDDDFWRQHPWQSNAMPLNNQRVEQPANATQEVKVEKVTPEISQQAEPAPAPEAEIQAIFQEIQQGGDQPQALQKEGEVQQKEVKPTTEPVAQETSAALQTSDAPKVAETDALGIRHKLYQLNDRKAIPVDAFREAAKSLEALKIKEN